MSQSKKNILILMSGSIAAYKICHLISQLIKNHHSVEVVMSASAQKFIGSTTIEGLTGKKPHIDLFESGSVMSHIHLERWADLILLAPATANTLNKMSHGTGDDLITSLFLAHDFKKPFLVAPAMNSLMYTHPTTQKSIKYLAELGLHFLNGDVGNLACGEYGLGRLMEPEKIEAEIYKTLNNDTITTTSNTLQSTSTKKHQPSVLITAGGTSEPIDDVRIITNKSTGSTASFIADHLISLGIPVVFLHAKSSQLPLQDCKKYEFTTFTDLDKHIRNLSSQFLFTHIIHAAAVSDYSVLKSTEGKIDSTAESIEIKLTKNPKLIDLFKKLLPNSTVFGFKLTSQLTDSQVTDKVKSLFKHSHCDYVVQNSWQDIQNGHHRFSVYDSTLNIQSKLTKDDLVSHLAQIILKESL